MELQFTAVSLGKKDTKKGPMDYATISGTNIKTGKSYSSGFYVNKYSQNFLDKLMSLRSGQNVDLKIEKKTVNGKDYFNPVDVSLAEGVAATAIPAVAPEHFVAAPTAAAKSFTPRPKDPAEREQIARSVAVNNGVLIAVELLKGAKDQKKMLDFALSSALDAANKFTAFILTGKTPLLEAGTLEKPELTLPEGDLPEIPDVEEAF